MVHCRSVFSRFSSISSSSRSLSCVLIDRGHYLLVSWVPRIINIFFRILFGVFEHQRDDLPLVSALLESFPYISLNSVRIFTFSPPINFIYSDLSSDAKVVCQLSIFAKIA